MDTVVFENFHAHVLLQDAVVFNVDEVGIDLEVGNEANAMDMYQANDVRVFRQQLASVELEQPPLPAPPILEGLLKCCPCCTLM